MEELVEISMVDQLVRLQGWRERPYTPYDRKLALDPDMLAKYVQSTQPDAWRKLSCRKFRDNEVRLQLHALAYNLATFLRCIELPEAMADWSLTSLQLKLIKIGARFVRHARAITFQLAEVAVTGPMVRAVLAAIRRLREPPLCA